MSLAGSVQPISCQSKLFAVPQFEGQFEGFFRFFGEPTSSFRSDEQSPESSIPHRFFGFFESKLVKEKAKLLLGRLKPGTGMCLAAFVQPMCFALKVLKIHWEEKIEFFFDFLRPDFFLPNRWTVLSNFDSA